MSGGDRRRRWARRALLVVIQLVLLAGVYWVFLAVTDAFIARQAPSTLIYRPHPFRRLVLVPGRVYRHGSVELHVNRHGFRGREPGIKADGALRIVALGGSSVFDHKLGDGRSWPERLAPNLGELGFAGVESYNAGIPGYSSRESLAFYHDTVRFFEPDVVIFYQGWNDLKYFSAFEDGVDVEAVFRLPDPARYRYLSAPRPLRNWYALREMLGLPGRSPLAEAGTVSGTAVRSAPPPVRRSDGEGWRGSPALDYWRHNVETLVAEVQRDGALPVLVAQNTLAAPETPAEDRRRIRYDFVDLEHDEVVEVSELMVEVLREVAADRGVPMIDLRPRFNGNSSYLADHVHLTPAGSQRFAFDLARALAPVLEGVGRSRGRAAGGTGAATLTIGYWPFDRPESLVADVSGNGLDGAAVGGAAFHPAGRMGGSLRLDGESGEAVVPASGLLDLTAGFAVEVWLDLGGREQPSSAGVVVKGGAYHLALRDGRPAFYGYGLEPAGWLLGSDRFPTDGWHRLRVEHRPGEVRLLVGEQVVQRARVEGAVQRSSLPLRIGAGNGHLRGAIDDVRLQLLDPGASP